MKHLTRPLGLGLLFAFTLLLGHAAPLATASPPHNPPPKGYLRAGNVLKANDSESAHIDCEDGSPVCTEVYDSTGYGGSYIGHDEPSLLFYSSLPHSGNSNQYRLILPKDPPMAPVNNGSGGTDNFMLHPAFWFGMAMCDGQSFPEYTTSCTPDSDSNIFENANPSASDFMGHHPGAAFMEMQFYPPGWVAWPYGNSCDATKWCAALNIDSLSEDAYTGAFNNPSCLATAGLEYVNFAFITKSGVSHAPASPLLATGATFTPDPTKDLFMSSGDLLQVKMFDTSSGFKVVIYDMTSGQMGSMTASAANDFGEVLFDPSGANCNAGTHNIPTDFHPMYSTSSEDTRVPWTAHSYNVAFSDEIGHFDYCYGPDAISPGGNCPVNNFEGDGEAADPAVDDIYCFPSSWSTFFPVGGCINPSGNPGFDGVPYQKDWPGTLANAYADRQAHPRPIVFGTPRTGYPEFKGTYNRVAFETDLPRIESNTCNRFTGAGCVDPPQTDDSHPAAFYPFFTTGMHSTHCIWQEGGALIPGTTKTFGGSAAAEYGPLLSLTYLGTGNTTSSRFNDFRQVLNSNPCPAW